MLEELSKLLRVSANVGEEFIRLENELEYIKTVCSFAEYPVQA